MVKRILPAVLAMLSALMLIFAFSCANNNSDIVGYYTPEKIDTVVYFAPDGKIYENYSSESISYYKVSGNTISMFVEGAENIKMEFELTRTESGIKIGDAVYTRIDERKLNADKSENDENNEDRNDDGDETDS